MKKHVVTIIMIISLAFSGGCAVVPALITTGASMAVPQTASMVITAASTVHKTVLIAADERSADDMLTDKFLSIQAQAMLLTEPGVDMEASSYNGDIYLAGDYATPADRDRVVNRLRELKGVHAVKGVIKQKPSDLLAAMQPAITDGHTESVIEAGLFKELHIKSANVDVEVVQGEAIVMGVVRDKEEEAHVIDVVKKLRPQSAKGLKVTSLLALQEVHESNGIQENAVYALKTSEQMLAEAKSQPAVPTKKAVSAPTQSVEIEDNQALENLYAHYFPSEPTLWEKARRRMKTRILDMAKAESNSQAKKELITLSSRVLNDKFISIERRLIKTRISTENAHVRAQVDKLLRDYAPERNKRLQTLAMN